MIQWLFRLRFFCGPSGFTTRLLIHLNLRSSICISSDSIYSVLCNHMSDLHIMYGTMEPYIIYSQQLLQNHTLFFPRILTILYLYTTRYGLGNTHPKNCTFLPPFSIEPLVYTYIYWYHLLSQIKFYRSTHIDILKPLRIFPTLVTWSIILKTRKQVVKLTSKTSCNRYIVFIASSVGVLFK